MIEFGHFENDCQGAYWRGLPSSRCGAVRRLRRFRGTRCRRDAAGRAGSGCFAVAGAHAAGARHPVLRHLSQPAGQNRRPDARQDGSRPRPGRRRDLGKGRPQAPRRDDAAAGRASSGPGHHRVQLISFLETSIDRAALAKPDPGRSPLHRLNRTEYANAIRDLLALDIDAAAFAARPTTKRTGSTTSPTCCASRPRCSNSTCPHRARSPAWRSAIPPSRRRAPSTGCRPIAPRTDHIEGLPLGTRGGIVDPPQLPSRRRIRLPRHSAAEHRRLRARPRVAAQLEISIDGERVFHGAGGRRGRQQDVGHEPGVGQGHAGRSASGRAFRSRPAPASSASRFIRKNSRRVGRAAAAVHPRPGHAEHERHPADRARCRSRGRSQPTGSGDTPSRRRISSAARRRPHRRPNDRVRTRDPDDAGAPRLSAAGQTRTSKP